MKPKPPKYEPNKIYKVTVIFEYKGYEMEEAERKIQNNTHKVHWFYEEKYEINKEVNGRD